MRGVGLTGKNQMRAEVLPIERERMLDQNPRGFRIKLTGIVGVIAVAIARNAISIQLVETVFADIASSATKSVLAVAHARLLTADWADASSGIAVAGIASQRI